MVSVTRDRDDQGVEEQAASGKRAIESGSEQHPPKRSRVSRACDQCRANREKCDGTQPSCQTCAVQLRTCSYKQPPRKRGIPTNYIRSLELTLAWLFQTFPDAELKLATSLPHKDDATTRAITNKDAVASDELHHAWRSSIISRQLEQALYGTTVETCDLSQLGGPAGFDGINIQQSPTSSPTPRTHVLQVPASEQTAPSPVQARLHLPKNAWILLEYYFAFTHSWLPIVDKSAVLKSMYTYSDDGLTRAESSTADHVELWSILALAEAQLNLQAPTASAELLRDTAKSLFPSEHGAFGMGHIRALLLLTLLETLQMNWLPAWLLIGTAVRLITYRTLASNTGSVDLELSKDHSRKLKLATFLLESTIASELDAPVHMRPEQITTLGFIDEDGLEEWSPWHDPLASTSSSRAPARSLSTFNRLLRAALDRTMIADEHDGRPTRTVLLLLQNAAQPESHQRMQPSAFIQHHLSEHQTQDGSRVPFVSIPTLPGADVAASASADGRDDFSLQISDTMFGIDAQAQNIDPSLTDPDFQSGLPVADIFEEFATIEDVDSNQHPKFMRNLGFADPDLDLAKFFGTDYLSTDSLAPYK